MTSSWDSTKCNVKADFILPLWHCGIGISIHPVTLSGPTAFDPGHPYVHHITDSKRRHLQSRTEVSVIFPSSGHQFLWQHSTWSDWPQTQRSASLYLPSAEILGMSYHAPVPHLWFSINYGQAVKCGFVSLTEYSVYLLVGFCKSCNLSTSSLHSWHSKHQHCVLCS